MRIKPYILVMLLLAIFISVVVSCGQEKTNVQTTEVDEYLNHNDTVKYVGIETCKNCHYDVYESYIKTGMGQSFDVASKAKSSSKLDDKSVLNDTHKNLIYHPYWEGEDLKLKEFRLKGQDTVHLRNETVDYIVGSGQHTNSHIYNTNGYLHQMPFTYYTQDGKLDLPPGYENGGNTRFNRKIGLECMSCHNAMPKGFVMGSINKFETVPNGINCERCHGPGELHVKEKMAGNIVDTATQTDYTIVNPKKLSPDLQFELCQRCHLQGNAVLKEGKSFFDFKPGMKLSDVMEVYLPKYSNSEDEFIMASHVDRFKMSECFIKNNKTFNCISCHNPHVSVKVTGSNVFNNTCNGCHTSAKEKICSEAEEKRLTKDNNCVDCHMPKSSSIDIPHVTVTDHYIKVPQEKAKTDAIKEFVGLYSINNSKLSKRSRIRAYIQQYEKFTPDPQFLDSALAILKTINQENLSGYFVEKVNIYFLKKEYNRIIREVLLFGGKDDVLKKLNKISYDNQHAWTAYRIGESNYNMGGIVEASAFYKKAVDLAPYVLDFQNRYGVSLVRLNKFEEAKKVFEFVILEDSKNAEAYSNLGFVNLRLNNSDLAEEMYKKALALNPDYEQALLNMAGLRLYQSRIKEAKVFLDRVLVINPNNKQALQVLNSISG